MKRFDVLSFAVGLGSGLCVLAVVFLVHGGRGNVQAGFPAGGFGQGQGGRMDPAQMAERLGMTQADLQKELDNGKTMRQIATEHGVQTGGPGGARGGSGTGARFNGRQTGSGAAAVVVSSSSSSSSLQ